MRYACVCVVTCAAIHVRSAAAAGMQVMVALVCCLLHSTLVSAIELRLLTTSYCFMIVAFVCTTG
jgi:hypothetical protein